MLKIEEREKNTHAEILLAIGVFVEVFLFGKVYFGFMAY